MAQVNVISVNPSKQTLGALNTERIENLARSCHSGDAAIHFPGLKSVCRFAFGVGNTASNNFSAKLALVRVVAAFVLGIATMSLTSILPISANQTLIATITIGSLIALGLFERLASLAGFIALTSIIISSALGMGGLTEFLSSPSNVLTAMIAFGYLALSILGPGSFSIDKILGRAVYRTVKQQIERRKVRKALHKAELRNSYKAWSSF